MTGHITSSFNFFFTVAELAQERMAKLEVSFEDDVAPQGTLRLLGDFALLFIVLFIFSSALPL